MTAVISFASSSGSFLITPNVGLMIWTLVVFLIALFTLRKYVYPVIAAQLDRRAEAIAEEIDQADRMKQESEKILDEYRERLKEARVQAEQIIDRARKAAEAHEREATEESKAKREQMMEQTRREIEAETRRAIEEIRREVADLTIMATEKVTRKILTADDQQRLVQEALAELDFTALSAGAQN
jgi:F-type H+-transporting ATPase subunit b